MSVAATAGGQWTDQAAFERSMEEIIGNVVSEWVTLAEDGKTIVFVTTTLHSTAVRFQRGTICLLRELS